MARKPALVPPENTQQNQSIDENILRPPGGGGTGDGMEARVAVLEQIAKDTREVLGDIKSELRDIRAEIKDIRNGQRTEFLWILGAIASLFALMAHGFHWF
jgi:hypothetical protein